MDSLIQINIQEEVKDIKKELEKSINGFYFMNPWHE